MKLHINPIFLQLIFRKKFFTICQIIVVVNDAFFIVYARFFSLYTHSLDIIFYTQQSNLWFASHVNCTWIERVSCFFYRIVTIFSIHFFPNSLETSLSMCECAVCDECRPFTAYLFSTHTEHRKKLNKYG